MNRNPDFFSKSIALMQSMFNMLSSSIQLLSPMPASLQLTEQLVSSVQVDSDESDEFFDAQVRCFLLTFPINLCVVDLLM